MIRKGLFLLSAFAMLTAALPACYGQSGAVHPAAAAKPGSTPAAPAHTATANTMAAPALAAGATSSSANSNCMTGPCDYQPPKITVANPPAIVTPWLVRDKISWAARLVLVLLAYVAIMMAVSLLYKIERQTRAAVENSEAARASADAALLQAQALRRAERPWLMVTVEPAADRENSFVVVAVNRGRSPAQIEAAKDQAILTADEKHLPATPEFPIEQSAPRGAPVILLPGESLELKRFGRDDVKQLCGTEDRLKRVEDWQEKIYLYGSILYADLTAAEGEPAHVTGWCCWYIHGRQKSGLVLAGPAAYRVHT